MIKSNENSNKTGTKEEVIIESQSNTKTLQRTEYKSPRLYAVTLYNDDITTMDFVVEMLVKIFHKSTVDASNVMIQVHQMGKGVAGIYTYDIAVTKKMQADRMAADKGFPLRLSVEWEDATRPFCRASICGNS